MGGAASFLVLGLQVSACQALVCPSPFQDILGVCLHFPTPGRKNTSWCEAQEFYSSVHGELVRGNNYLPLAGKTFSGMPEHYWIGLTDLLHERRNNRSGWRWTDGAVADSPPLIWNGPEPSFTWEDCVFQSGGSGKLSDLNCRYFDSYWQAQVIAPMCQQRSQPSSAERFANYEAVPIPVGLPEAEYAHNCGCSRLVAAVASKIECAALCSREPGDWCVAFYFNEEKMECRLVLYIDANIDMGDAQGWIKFSKKQI